MPVVDNRVTTARHHLTELNYLLSIGTSIIFFTRYRMRQPKNMETHYSSTPSSRTFWIFLSPILADHAPFSIADLTKSFIASLRLIVVSIGFAMVLPQSR